MTVLEVRYVGMAPSACTARADSGVAARHRPVDGAHAACLNRRHRSHRCNPSTAQQPAECIISASALSSDAISS